MFFPSARSFSPSASLRLTCSGVCRRRFICAVLLSPYWGIGLAQRVAQFTGIRSVPPDPPVPRPRTAADTCREFGGRSPSPGKAPSPSTEPRWRTQPTASLPLTPPFAPCPWATWRQLECQRCPARDLSALSRYSTRALGSAARMRTPTDFYVSTSRREPISRFIHRQSSIESLVSSTGDLARRSGG